MKEGKITDLVYRNGIAELKIRTGKKDFRYYATMNLTEYAQLSKKQKCKYEAKREILTKLVVDGKDILEKSRISVQKRPDKPASSQQQAQAKPPKNAGQTQSQQKVGRAKAPYNFVPIDPEVVKAKNQAPGIVIAETPDGKIKYPAIPSFERYHEGLYTGYIDLNIETLTPLYIRDSYDADEDIKADNAKRQGEKWENPDFFSPGNRPKIPGSSLRGMVRNLVEIVSYSRMDTDYVENKRFYYRRVAERNSRYQQLMLNLDWETGFSPKTEAGWLKRKNDKYVIFPLEKPNIYRINAYQRDNLWKINPKDAKSKSIVKHLPQFGFHKIFFIPTAEKKHMHGRNKNIPLRYALINDFQLDHTQPQDKGYEKGYLILSGSMGNKKHFHPVIHLPKDNPAENEITTLNEDIVKSYKEDISRQEDADLFKMLDSNPAGVPCFYIRDRKGNIKSIGHTPLFRLAYDKKVKDHIPRENSDFKGIDFARAIFGDADRFAGRVFFEDAKSVGTVNQHSELSPKILSTPKPTTIQHYLRQDRANKDQAGDGRLFDWNDTTNIRGYKLYWHRKTPQKGENGWEASLEDVKKSPSQYTVVKTIDKGAHFQGRIRFENLSNIELGALLFVLDLPNGCAHKIGMGKPLGLGSVRIKSTLTLSKRTDKAEGRYGRLFNKQKWHLAEDPAQIDDFKDYFAEYMLTETKHDKATSGKAYWDTERMQELRAMLDFNQNTGADDWLERTRYLELSEFKQRPVLASPLETIKAAGIKYE